MIPHKTVVFSLLKKIEKVNKMKVKETQFCTRLKVMSLKMCLKLAGTSCFHYKRSEMLSDRANNCSHSNKSVLNFLIYILTFQVKKLDSDRVVNEPVTDLFLIPVFFFLTITCE